MGFRTCSSLKFHSVSFRISPLSPPVQAPTWVNLHFPHRLTITTTPFASYDRLYLRSSCAVACSRRAQPGNDLSSSAEGERGGSDLKYDANNLGNLNSKADGEVQEHQSYQSSVRTVALCVSTAAAFGLGVGFKDGAGKASEFFAGYILEQSLSVDNLFVFVLIFKYFKVPFKYQNRVLSYGIAGAIIFRLTLILLGTATLQRFEAVNLLLAVILLYSSFKLFTSEEDDSDLSDNFIVKACQRFIPVTTYYDGNKFFTQEGGIWKVSNILSRPHLCSLL